MLLIPLAPLFAGEREDFQRAEQLFQKGAWEASLERLSDFIEDYPLSRYRGDAQFRRGAALYRLGRYPEASEVFTLVQRRYPGSRFYGLLPYWQGRTWLILGQTKAAREALDRCFSQETLPEEIRRDALFLLLQSYRRTGEGDRGLALMEDLAGDDSPSLGLFPEEGADWDKKLAPEGIYLLGEKRRWEDLLAWYGPALEDQEDWQAFPVALYYYAEALREQPENRAAGGKEALAIWENLSLGEGRVALLALIRRLGEDPPPADPLTFFNSRRAALASVDPVLWKKAAEAAAYLLYQGEGDSGRRKARDLLEKEGAQGPLLARIYLEEGRWEEGLALLEGNSASYLSLYGAYRRGEYPEVRRRLEDLGKERSLPHERLYGAVLMRQGEYRRAAEVLRGPAGENPSLRMDLAKALFGAGRYTRVLETLASAQPATERDEAIILYLKALSEVGTGRYRQAEVDLEAWMSSDYQGEVSRLMTPYIRYYTAYVKTLVQPPDYEAALEGWRQTAALHSDLPLGNKARLRRGTLLYRLGRYSEAAEELELLRREGLFALPPSGLPEEDAAAQAGLSRDERARGLYLLGLAYGESDQDDLAESRIREAFMVSGEDEEYRWALFHFLRERERGAEALAVLSPLLTSAVDGEALFQAALVKEGLGDQAGAFRLYQQYLQSFPRGKRRDAVLHRSALIRWEKGQTVGAYHLWQRLIDDGRDAGSNPYRAEALYRTLLYHWDRQEWNEALARMDQLIEEYPEESRVRELPRMKERLLLESQGKTGREAALRSRIKGGLDQGDAREAALELAEILLTEGRSEDEARQWLQEIKGLQKRHPLEAARAALLLGQDHFNAGRLVQAGQAFLQAADWGRGDSEVRGKALYRALEVLLLAGQKTMADDVRQELKGEDPSGFWAAEADRLWEARQ